ncbi:MAG: ABC transporter substrate-binding protein, partial [Alcaligenaceae bacterium]|nr:ABC transporter substrate-binding protein [Alcaligenaceae bacterium]
GGIYGRYIASSNPKAKVVVLKQGDSFGDEYFEGFKKALDENGIEILEVETYDPGTPSIDSQIIKLASTKADVLLIAAAPKYATQAIAKKGELGWDATTFISTVSSSIGSVLEPAGLDNAKGVITAAVVKDPSDSRWDNDADMKTYKASAERYGYDPLDAFIARGYSIAATFVKALEGTKAPTQAAFMESVRNMDYAAPLLLPGVRIITSPTDGFAVESAQLERFDGSKWVPFGDVVSFNGKTLEARK